MSDTISQPSPAMSTPTAAAPAGTVKTSRFTSPGEGSSLGISIVTVGLLLALWFAATNLGWIKPLFLPSPQAVFTQFMDYLTGAANDKPLWQHFVASMLRVTIAFWLAFITAVPLGIAMGAHKGVEAFLEPFVSFCRYLPASAFIPLFILWLGIGETEKIAVIFFGTFFQMTLMVMDVTKNVSQELIDTSYTLGVSKRSVFWRIILPASLPGIVDTLRITFGWAWTYLVVAEIVAASSGLGYMIMQSQRFLKTSHIIVGILVIGVIGIIIDLIFKWLYGRLFPWMGKGGAA